MVCPELECCGDVRCHHCGPDGVCDHCDTIDGRLVEEVSEYASTCDYCCELAMHESMIMDERTQLGICDRCIDKGITLDVFKDYPTPPPII